MTSNMSAAARTGNRITPDRTQGDPMATTPIPVQQALYFRRDREGPTLQARSAGFVDSWLPEAERLVFGFGDRPPGTPCPPAVFAQPLTPRQVAVVRVHDRAPSELAFHLLVMDRGAYERFAGDPFAVAARLASVWDAHGEVPVLAWPAEPPPVRTVAQVQAVLRRVKAFALREGEDPEAPDFERTADNSESPAMLGGAQVLVDGGKLVFERPGGDLPLVEGLWTLLPEGVRGKVWPASFAFGNELGFDVAVIPRLAAGDFEGYTTEDQAAEYPPGSYEMALQVAAEAGDQRELQAAFRRQSSGEVLRMAMWLLVGMMLLVIGSRWFLPQSPQLDERPHKAAAAAGIVAVADPWTAACMLEYGHRLWTTPE
jgi:hypothetical protein